MSTRTELKSFLLTDLPTVVGATFDPGTGNTYFGRDRRVKRKDREIFCRWSGFDIVLRKLGRYVMQSVDIELFQSRYDGTELDGFQEDIEAASALVQEAYDGNTGKFRTPITKQVELVRCFELTDVVISERDQGKRVEGSQVLRLDVYVWET